MKIQTAFYIIDSGNDKDAGRKIKKILEQKNWNLKAILNTHSNADHIEVTNFTKTFSLYYLFYTYGKYCNRKYYIRTFFSLWWLSLAALRHKFLMAQNQVKHKILQMLVCLKGFEILSLPGHFWDMIGFKTPDNVYF